MNHTRIPNASDENSILITAEFFEDGRRLRTDRTRVHRYELDLIVPDDITLDQLLEAVHDGICAQLDLRYQVDAYDLDANPAYLDTIKRFERIRHRAEQLPKEFFRERKLRRPCHYRRHAAVTAKERWDAAQAPDDELIPGEEDLWRWLVCWDVFCCCYDQYRKGYPEHAGDKLRLAFRKKVYPKHPVIACGGISTRNWSGEAEGSLAKRTQIWLRSDKEGRKTLRELGFFSSSRLIFDPNSHHSATPWFDALELRVPEGEQFPVYHVSKRPDVRTLPTEIRIDDPGSVRKPPVPAIFLACGALLAGTAAFLPAAVLAAFLGPLEASLSRLALCCGGLLALTAAWVSYRTLCRRRHLQWYRHYESYIRDILHRLQVSRQENAGFLLERYPPAYSLEDTNDLVERTFRVDGSISGRRPDQEDFLHVRIGLSQEGSHTSRSLIQFHLPQHDEVFSAIRYKNIRSIRSLPFTIIPPESHEEAMLPNDGTVGFLNSLAEDIRDSYTWLDNAPVMMDLHHARAMGVYFQDPACSFYPLLNNMLLDLCYHHSPGDLQFVMFCPEIQGIRKQQEYIRQFKQLPHFQHLLRDQSQFVFDSYYAGKVMDQLHHIYTMRREVPEAAPGCHIIVLLLEDHGFRRHQLAKLLPSSAEEIETGDNSITFLFFSHYENRLPPYCSHIFKVDSNRNCSYVPYVHRFSPGVQRAEYQTAAQYGITPDSYASCFLRPGAASDHDRMYQSFKILSALRQDTVSQSVLPRQLELMRLLELSHPELPSEHWFHATNQSDQNWQSVLITRMDRFVSDQWSASDGRTDLRIPVGVNADRPVWLDLDQMHDLLIASDPGMGKTETLVTCLKSLCIHYSPESVRLFLIDPRTSGLAARLDGWDQVALAMDASVPGGLSAALIKMFRDLRGELNRRSADLNLMGVGDISAFNRSLLELDTHIRERLRLHPVRDLELIERLQGLKRMPRLIIAVDHADQILDQLRFDGAEQAALGELCWLLENGRTFGVHVLLASGRPGELLQPELQTMFAGRLCLKTEDPALSQMMLGSKLAAAPYMPSAGRAYLRSVLTGETDYVQIALCLDEVSAVRDAPFRVTMMEPGDTYLLFYDSEGEIPDTPGSAKWSPVTPKGRKADKDPGADSGRRRTRKKRSGPRNKKADAGHASQKKDGAGHGRVPPDRQKASTEA